MDNNCTCQFYLDMDDELDNSGDSNATEISLGSQDTDDEKKLAKARKSEDKKWVHVERALREDAYMNLAMQKRVILVSQCNECRADRNHAISTPYGSDYLIVINNCRSCLDTNIEIGKVYLNYWPNVDDRQISHVPKQKSGEREIFPQLLDLIFILRCI